MSEFWQGLLVAICSNSLLGVLIGFWLKRELQRQDKHLDSLNAKAQTRFNKYHLDAVDAIARSYALLVDVHNSVFRYCMPDWDRDPISPEERKKAASVCMVVFYEHFRKNQIFMEDDTIEKFEKSFRFLQTVYQEKDVPDLHRNEGVRVAMSIYADMNKTLPGLLQSLRNEIKRRIGPEPEARSDQEVPNG